MATCTSCGSYIPEGQGKSCSMCYGDPAYGRDGYYQAWIDGQQQEQEQPQEQEQEQPQEQEPAGREGVMRDDTTEWAYWSDKAYGFLDQGDQRGYLVNLIDRNLSWWSCLRANLTGEVWSNAETGALADAALHRLRNKRHKREGVE